MTLVEFVTVNGNAICVYLTKSGSNYSVGVDVNGKRLASTSGYTSPILLHSLELGTRIGFWTEDHKMAHDMPQISVPADKRVIQWLLGVLNGYTPDFEEFWESNKICIANRARMFEAAEAEA